MVTRASKLSVRGRVQMVGYRRHVLDVAWELGIAGYVRNEPNGSVTVVAQGDEKTLKKFRERLAGPPPPAEVKEIVASAARVKPRLKDFSIKSGTMQDELREGLGGMETEFRDYRKEFKGFNDDFKDYRTEFKDFKGEFRDYRGEFKDYREEFRGFASRTDENFKLLSEKYGEISEKLTSIMNTLIEQSKRTSDMLELIRSDSRETREMLNESMRLLRAAIEKLPGRQP